MLKVSKLEIIQAERSLWRDFSLELAPGEIFGISAPSGYGKTTLGRVLAGWQKPQGGVLP